MIREERPGVTADMTELDALLEEVGRRGFMLHIFRADSHGPDVIAGVLQHSVCADVFVFSGDENAHAYRLPTDAESDVFAPGRVYWWYGACPVWTLRALLTLERPEKRSFPLTVPPPGLGVRGARVPVRMRRRFGRELAGKR